MPWGARATPPACAPPRKAERGGAPETENPPGKPRPGTDRGSGRAATTETDRRKSGEEGGTRGRRTPAPPAYGAEARLHKSPWLPKNVPASGSWLGVTAERLGVYGPTPAARGPTALHLHLLVYCTCHVGGVAGRILPCWVRGLPCESEGPLTHRVSSHVGGVAGRTLPCWGHGLPFESEGPLMHKVSSQVGGVACHFWAKPVDTSQAVETT